MKRKFLSLLMLSMFLLVAACSATPRLHKAATQLYSNEAGYHLTLPADWRLISEDADSSVFTAPDDAVSLTIINELGGEAYYGLDEITEMLLPRPQEETANSQWQTGRLIADTEEKHRQVFTGEDEAGATVYLDITVMQPYPGIRYYLLFAAGSAAYNTQNTLISDMVLSFGLDEDIPYLYALMEERRADAAEEFSTEESPE